MIPTHFALWARQSTTFRYYFVALPSPLDLEGIITIRAIFLIRDGGPVRRILSVAVLWFTSFFTLTLSIGFGSTQAFQGGLIGVVIGMVIVAILVLQSDYTRAVFFGSGEGLLLEEGLAYFLIGCLTDGIPIFLFGLALMIFMARQLSFQ
jgi:hypothetical protein